MTTKYGVKELEKETGKLTFARALKAYRLGEELSQVSLADLLGISKQSLNDLENGRTLPSLSRASGIAKKLGLSSPVFVELAIQDLLNRANLNMTVKIQDKKKRVS